MATHDSLLNIGNRFKVSPTTVMNVVNKLLNFVLKIKKIYIKFPETEEELLNISRGFKKYPGISDLNRIKNDVHLVRVSDKFWFSRFWFC